MANQAAMATQWLSRTIAIVILMITPCYIGYLIDQKLGSKLWSVVGIAVGMLAMTTVFLVMAKQMIPPAEGSPLTDEDFEDDRDTDDHPDSLDAVELQTQKPSEPSP
ncbi:MAG: hypothetical protein Aurels2KO_26010 [Aureliella sp.]